MFLVHLWNYIRGYVIIIAKGKSIERFINICTKRQILLWDIVRQDESSAVMKASARGFRLMRPAAKKSGCRVHILKKCGLPFFFTQFKKRKGFKAGMLLFAVLIVFFTSMIWDIEIKGCNDETTAKILKVLETERVGLGSFKMGVDPKKIASKILLNIDEVAWAGVDIRGVKMTVTIENTVKPPEIVNYNAYYNLVAERDGLVTGLEVLSGATKVKEGDTVKKGQLLVAGTMEAKFPEFGTKDTRAMGRVLARTWYEERFPVAHEYVKRIRTGKSHENTYIRILGSKIAMPGNKIPFAIYEVASFDKSVAGPFGSKLPIGLTIETYYEIDEKTIALSDEEAQALALETIRSELTKKLSPDCKVLDERINFLKDDSGKDFVEITLECEEDIALSEPLGGEFDWKPLLKE